MLVLARSLHAAAFDSEDDSLSSTLVVHCRFFCNLILLVLARSLHAATFDSACDLLSSPLIVHFVVVN